MEKQNSVSGDSSSASSISNLNVLDKRKNILLTLIKTLGNIKNIRELETILFLYETKYKKKMYDLERFYIASDDGVESKEIDWDIISLDLNDYITTQHSVRLSPNKDFSSIALPPIEKDFFSMLEDMYKNEIGLKCINGCALYLCGYLRCQKAIPNDMLEPYVNQVLKNYNYTDKEIEIIKQYISKYFRK